MERNYELNANCIAKTVIEKETAFLNTDFKSLGLYDKCRYLIHYAHGFHPSVDYGANRAAMISSLIPELRACAMTGDVKARAYLVFMLMRLGIEYKDLADFLFNYELKRENPYVELASLNMCFKPTDDDVKLAHKLEEKATEMRREVVLEPMSPYERRIVHTALAESQTVTTRSDGKEPNRYVVIVPNDKDEFAKPYNAGRNDKGRKNDNRRGGNRGRNDRRGGKGGKGGRSVSGFIEKPKKSSSFSFGTYLGNSLKDK
jgi:hypothetical protein